MHSGVILWLVIFAVSVVVFFVVAAVVAVNGFSDLRSLLRSVGSENEFEVAPDIQDEVVQVEL